MTRALVPIADGTEEIEAVIAIDVMRRAKWDVIVAGLKPGPLTMSRKVRIVPDEVWADVNPGSFDVLVVPGGAGGVANLRKDERVLKAVRDMHAAGKLVCAVCAGPLVLQDAGILNGRRATCHPDVASQLTKATYVDEEVVTDGEVITSQGAGTTFPFALAIVAKVDGREKADLVARGMVWKMRSGV
jgi:protein deglycase